MTDYTTQFHTELTSGSSSGAGSRVFYVDPAAAPGGNGQSEGAAWNSFDYVHWYAENVGFRPGDTILLARGHTYDSQDGFWLKGDGTAELPITLGAYGNGSPPLLTNSHYVPDATGQDTSISDAVLNVDQGSSHWVIRDIDIGNPSGASGNVTDAGIRVLGTDVTIENVEISETGTGIWFGRNAASNTGAPTQSAFGLVEHCYIHDLSMVRNSVGGDDDYGCVGVAVLANDVTVRNNTFQYLMQPSFDYGWDGAAVELYGSVQRLTVQGNYVESVNALTEVGGRSVDSVSDIWFQHNIVVNAESLAYFHNGGGSFALGSIANVNFISNTVYATGNRSDSSSFAFGFGGGNASFLSVTNNIFAMQSLDFWSVGAINFLHSHNLYDAGAVPFPAGYFTATEYQGAAGFLDPAARDFRITAGSDALNRAAAIAGHLIDYMNHDLTGRVGLDIGAVEYWAGSEVHGTANSDSLIGTGETDSLWGYQGNDFLDGRGGADRMDGGSGSDTYVVDQLGDQVIEVSATGGVDMVLSSLSFTLGSNVERLTLTGAGAINGVGNELPNSITGNSVANIIDGKSGADFLDGGDGNDTLYGGTGNDELVGGRGLDIFIGGRGTDEFLFRPGDFSSTTRAGADWIQDFSRTDGDLINVGAIDANATIAGDQAFIFIGSAAFSGSAGQLRYGYEKVGKVTETVVYGDVNGDGIADFAIRLTGQLALMEGDFII